MKRGPFSPGRSSPTGVQLSTEALHGRVRRAAHAPNKSELHKVRELVLSEDEFTEFSVPHALCLAGEHQYSLGLAPIVIATNLRVHAGVEETAEEFQIGLADERAAAGSSLKLLARWRAVLEELAGGEAERMEGLRITLRLQATGDGCPPEITLPSPAVAVALACAVRTHRGPGGTVPDTEMAELAAGLLREFNPSSRMHPDRFYAECLVSLQGGAWYVSSAADSLNVQLMVPPESLILAVSREADAGAGGGAWEAVLLSALRKMGRSAAELLDATERDASRLFELAPSGLDEREMAVLYGQLRVREMIAQHLERLWQPLLDHDLLAELCDEESTIIEDYFEFPAARYHDVRTRAMESGALGAKFTYAFGTQPAMIILAPGRRDEVKEILEGEFHGCSFMSVDVDPEGAGASQVQETDDAPGWE